ncbi:unnamed protein product [Ectocarpus sp. 12 AP-2014]
MRRRFDTAVLLVVAFSLVWTGGRAWTAGSSPAAGWKPRSAATGVLGGAAYGGLDRGIRSWSCHALPRPRQRGAVKRSSATTLAMLRRGSAPTQLWSVRTQRLSKRFVWSNCLLHSCYTAHDMVNTTTHGRRQASRYCMHTQTPTATTGVPRHIHRDACLAHVISSRFAMAN